MASPNQHDLLGVTAIAIGGRGLILRGPPGSGKSSLALALIDRGARLIGDDGVQVQALGDRLVAHPPPNIAGKLEIRNVGLVDLPPESAPIALILELDDDPPRFRENADSIDLFGMKIPAIGFCPGEIAPAQRAEWALLVHGLAFQTDEADEASG